nr:DEAD/DEAH box helicase [Streptomyces sulphureus]
MPRKLRPHQVEAMGAAVRALEVKPGECEPEGGLRATLVSACGTGKTKTAIHTGERLAPRGRILVLVPTLELLSQTVSEWRAEGRGGAAYAVCSLGDDPLLWSAEVRSTTSAPQLALWANRHRQVTVFATYASLPVLVEAHEGAFGLAPLPRWDLVIVDEAHRTSGSWGKAWAAVHDQTQLPARRRLYLTATPRVWEERPPSARVREGVREALPAEVACSMDDPDVFGPVCYELPLADAIRRELLARFQIVCVEVRDPELPPEELYGERKREEEIRGKRLAAAQAAVCEAMADRGLRTLITYHHRTVEAEAWARSFRDVAAKLHAEAPERHPDSGRVWAEWLCGEHESSYRRRVLGEFGSGDADRAVLSNCRVLTEGVDVPSVDSVALIDPKGSMVDIVQAVGRALRQQPRQGKMATLIVPVFLDADENPERMLESGAYKPLVTVLQALRAHDEKMVDMLALPQTPAAEVSVPERVGPAPDDGEEGRLLLRFSTRRDPAELARFVQMRVLEPERDNWRAGYAAATRYQAAYGDLRVPYHYRDEDTYPLGWWIAEQRRQHADDILEERRVQRLDELGMVWSERDEHWRIRIDAARAYHAEHGTLCVPQNATWDELPLGRWLANLRQPGGLGADPERAAQRADELAAIDPDWNPRTLGWNISWQRRYTRLANCLRNGTTLNDIRPGHTIDGEDLGTWLHAQRQRWEHLVPGQQERLTALGVTPQPAAPTGPKTTAAPSGGARAAAWERGRAAAEQYRNRHGTLTGVPRHHIETIHDTDGEHPVKLGVWLSNQRTRRDRLTPERAEQLRELGVL